jgi:hypothetical protein
MLSRSADAFRIDAHWPSGCSIRDRSRAIARAQRLVLRRPRQHDGALDAQYRILGSLIGVRWVPALADKSVSEGANPSDEVSGDCGGKPIACSVESKSTDEANASARAKIGIDASHMRRMAISGKSSRKGWKTWRSNQASTSSSTALAMSSLPPGKK